MGRPDAIDIYAVILQLWKSVSSGHLTVNTIAFDHGNGQHKVAPKTRYHLMLKLHIRFPQRS